MVIKKLRLENGWSQEQLAQLTGLSTRTIQRIEKENKASLSSLNLLADVFNLTVKELEDQLNIASIDNQNIKDSNNSKKVKVFFLMNFLLFCINMLTNTEHLWFIYPLLGWGIPLFYKIYLKKEKEE